MARKRMTWKTRSINSSDDIGMLQSYADSSRGSWQRWAINIYKHGGGGEIETNLPWAELAAWFRYAQVPLRRDQWVLDSMPLEERVKEWEREEQEQEP